MAPWVEIAVNTVLPILAGLVILLSLALYVMTKEVAKRVPTKEEMMDMGYTVAKTVVEEKMEEFGITVPPSGSAPSASGAGRPSEGLLGKIMWFAEHTDIGRQIAGRFLGGDGGGGGGGGTPQNYYG